MGCYLSLTIVEPIFLFQLEKELNSENYEIKYPIINLKVLKSVGITINGDQLPFRTSATPMGQDIPEFTGDKRVSNLGWDREGQIQVEQTQPLPMTILGITGTLVTSD